MPVIYNSERCLLGEGALWHPLREELFWFDILAKRLHSQDRVWDFAVQVSAAGWLDADSLLIASEQGFFTLNLEKDTREAIVSLEAEWATTRSNDGRADPYGGFWIGTMGKAAEHEAGAIYRYYRGEVRRLYDRITIPNAICFSPSGDWAYFCDTAVRRVWRQRLDPKEGWPQGAPERWLDLGKSDLNPDGAVVDRAGRFWNALWGAGAVACYSPAGEPLFRLAVPAPQVTCPAFGGTGRKQLFCTSAREGLAASMLERYPASGATFALDLDELAMTIEGQAEHRVVL